MSMAYDTGPGPVGTALTVREHCHHRLLRVLFIDPMPCEG